MQAANLRSGARLVLGHDMLHYINILRKVFTFPVFSVSSFPFVFGHACSQEFQKPSCHLLVVYIFVYGTLHLYSHNCTVHFNGLPKKSQREHTVHTTDKYKDVFVLWLTCTIRLIPLFQRSGDHGNCGQSSLRPSYTVAT